MQGEFLQPTCKFLTRGVYNRCVDVTSVTVTTEAGLLGKQQIIFSQDSRSWAENMWLLNSFFLRIPRGYCVRQHVKWSWSESQSRQRKKCSGICSFSWRRRCTDPLLNVLQAHLWGNHEELIASQCSLWSYHCFLPCFVLQQPGVNSCPEARSIPLSATLSVSLTSFFCSSVPLLLCRKGKHHSCMSTKESRDFSRWWVKDP